MFFCVALWNGHFSLILASGGILTPMLINLLASMLNKGLVHFKQILDPALKYGGEQILLINFSDNFHSLQPRKNISLN